MMKIKRKRKVISDKEEDQDVRDDVSDYIVNILKEEEQVEKTSLRKQKKSRNDVHHVPLDEISFHTLQDASRYKYMVRRNIAPGYEIRRGHAVHWDHKVHQ